MTPDLIDDADRDLEIAAKIRKVRFPWHWRKLEHEGAFTNLGPISVAEIVQLIKRRNELHWLVEGIVKFAFLIPITFVLFIYFRKYVMGPQLIISSFFTSGGWTTYFATTPQRRAARVLASTNSKLALPSLIGGLKYTDKRTRKVLQDTIGRHLRNATVAEFEAIQKEERTLIYDSMHAGSRQFAFDAIEFATQFQDVSALPAMKRLAATRTSPFARDRAARTAARRCARVLNERVEAAKRNEKLLRPAEAPTSDTLLQPVGQPGVTHHLLHPLDSDENEVITTIGHNA